MKRRLYLLAHGRDVGVTMTYRGYIENGKVRLVEETGLADGTEVRVEPVRQSRPKPQRRKSVSPKRGARARNDSLASHYAGVIGVLTDLPRDFSRQHDHYLYGHPKHR